MTKREIYEQVVRLTSEIAETKIAQKIFDAAMYGDVEKTDMIINAFPYYYPELYERIVSFGDEFNELGERFRVNNKMRDEVMLDIMQFMQVLVQTGYIGLISETVRTGKAQKLQEAINDLERKYPYFNQELLALQNQYNKLLYDDTHTEHEGKIFGTKVDEENGVFVFDTNIIDVLSFYVLTILAEVSDDDFFYDKEVEEDGEMFTVPDKKDFANAIEEATNEEFAWFVENCRIVYCYCSDGDGEHHSVGKTLVDALMDEF